MKTTLKKIKANDPCEPGWDKLLAALSKTEADDEPIELSFILQSNGFNDTLWVLRAVDGYEKEMRLFAVFCARQVQHLMTDEISINAIDVAERFAHGEATELDLVAARDAARAASAAARDAARAASAAARDAARDAAWAASAAARVAAWDAAWAASAAASAAAENDEPAIKTAIREKFKKLISL
jgi:hypothetical protein